MPPEVFEALTYTCFSLNLQLRRYVRTGSHQQFLIAGRGVMVKETMVGHQEDYTNEVAIMMDWLHLQLNLHTRA